jgi:dihydroorotate dehydrogenase
VRTTLGLVHDAAGEAPLIYSWLRPVLQRIDPERAHALTLALAETTGDFVPLRIAAERAFRGGITKRVRAFGLNFPNRVGLAAGYDKDGRAWRGLACLGFGHVEVGTVTPRPQPGNPRPRLFRLTEDRSLINRLGFPSRGAEFVARRLGRERSPALVVGVNVGKQRETPLDRATEDYESLMDRFAGVADYLTVNISSPNTPELRRLEQVEWLAPLLDRLARRKRTLERELGRAVPVLIKLSPDLDSGQLAAAVRAIEGAGMDGIVATNTSTARDGLGSKHAHEVGGLSGAALTARSTEVVRQVRASTRLPIIASGGVMTEADARAKIAAGATLVQLYTGLVYEGPGLVRRVAEALG